MIYIIFKNIKEYIWYLNDKQLYKVENKAEHHKVPEQLL